MTINNIKLTGCHAKIDSPQNSVRWDRFLQKKWSPEPILAAKIGPPCQNGPHANLKVYTQRVHQCDEQSPTNMQVCPKPV